MDSLVNKNTIKRFDVAGPRYTSYPTAPTWTDEITQDAYIHHLHAFGASDKTLSLYIHIPFCETLCSFCGCNVLIRKNEEKHGDRYLQYLFNEIDLVTHYIGAKKEVRQLHWGGGTPTFLSEDQIEQLFKKIKENFAIEKNAEIAIEIDPRTISLSKLTKLKSLGFNRISMGIQDFNPKVQEAVNRRQPYELVKEINDWCSALKFHSLNFDLIYGLPYQTLESFDDTVQKVCSLKPDRIALYSFAYVPWLKKHQTKLNQKAFPEKDLKLDIFLSARQKLLEAGYLAIAMDHFAAKRDELAVAFKREKLYRNFMGYTTKPADEYIGLGLTSIGFLENTFIQNYKTIKDYYRLLDENQLPVERGKALTKDDQIRQWVIHSLMCHFKVDRAEFEEKFKAEFDTYFSEEKPHIKKCIEEGLLLNDLDAIRATELGKLFVRNICMGFDWHLRQKDAHTRFSRTI